MTARASIVIPAYNAQKYIAAAIASAQAQTLRNIEILVCDDCSTDATAEIVRRIAACDDRVKLYRTAVNGGPAAARNVLLDVAISDWIVILDADDRFHPDRVAVLLGLAERTGADLVADTLMIVDQDGCQPDTPMLSLSGDVLPDPYEVTFTTFIEHSLGRRNVPRGVSWVGLQPAYRKAFLARHGLRFDEGNRWGEDYLLFIACFVHGAQMCITPRPMYFHTMRADSLTDAPLPADLWRIVQADQTLLQMPAVSGNRRLARAIRRHQKAHERWYFYRIFADALKMHRFADAATLAFSGVSAARHILHESVIQSPRWLRKQLRMRIRRHTEGLSDTRTIPAR